MEDLVHVAEPAALDSTVDIADLQATDETEAGNDLEPIEIFIEQPDGSKVRISFLANGEIEGDPQNMLPQTYEPVPNIDEPSGSLDNDGSELLATFVNSESSQQVSAIQTPDGQIYYIESYPSPKSGKEPQEEQGSILYTLLQKDLYNISESDPLKQATENALAEETSKDSVYTIAREKLKPFVKVHKPRGRTESSVTQIGSELHLEEKMAAMAALLPTVAPKPHVSKKATTAGKSEAAKDALYRCDMCDAAYCKPQQFYGHSRAHSIERQLRCSHCHDNTVFAAHSKLAQHERRFHISVRSHVCSVCEASFDRASQLLLHKRRIHMQERPHRCAVCPKAFFKLSDLRSHLNIHFGLNVKVCDTCGKRFNHVSNLNRHLRTHSGARPFVCATCGRRFVQQSGLAMHEQIHRPAQTVCCPTCRAEFKNEASLRGHIRVSHSLVQGTEGTEAAPGGLAQRRRFYCRVCGEVFPYQALLKNHEAGHAAQQTFPCSWCKLDLPSAHLLKNHACQSTTQRAAAQAAVLAAEDGQKMLDAQMECLLGAQAADGSAASNDIVIYVTHEGQVQPTQVHIKSGAAGKYLPVVAETSPAPAPRSPSSEHKMPALAKLEREDDLEVSLGERSDAFDEIDTKEERFRFKRETDFQEGPADDDGVLDAGHEQYKAEADEGPPSGELGDAVRTMDVTITVLPASSEAASAGPRNSATKIYKCAECGKIFFKRSNYEQHLGTHFAHARRHLCPVCGQSFAWRSTMGKHLSTHEPPGKRQTIGCPICQKEYLLPAQIQNHIKRDHLNERPHACASCDKSFFKKNDLTVHLRTHTKEMPYICGTCGKRFGHVSHIIRHELIHSGQRPYPCPDCGKRFTQSNTLKVHRASLACKSDAPVDATTPDEAKPPRKDSKRAKRDAKGVECEKDLAAEDFPTDVEQTAKDVGDSGGCDSSSELTIDGGGVDVGASQADLAEFILPRRKQEVVSVKL